VPTPRTAAKQETIAKEQTQIHELCLELDAKISQVGDAKDPIWIQFIAVSKHVSSEVVRLYEEAGWIVEYFVGDPKNGSQIVLY